jgi:hypothetical protein
MVVDAEDKIASVLAADAPALLALAGHTQGFTYPPGRSSCKPHRRCSCLLLCPPVLAGTGRVRFPSEKA